MTRFHLSVLAVNMHRAGIEYMRDREEFFSERMIHNYQLHDRHMERLLACCRRRWQKLGKALLDWENRYLMCWRVVRNIYHAPLNREGDRIERLLNYADLGWANFTAIYLASGGFLGAPAEERAIFRELLQEMLKAQVEYMKGYQMPFQGAERRRGFMLWKNCFDQTRDLFEECGYQLTWNAGQILRRAYGGEN